MKDKLILVLGLVAAITLLGFGCAGQKNDANETSPTGALELNVNQPGDGFVLTAQATGEGAVEVTLQKAAAEGGGWKLMHSSKPSNTANPYWQRLPPSQTKFKWSNLPVGKRYFSACELDKNKAECLKYSNEVEVEVK